ncbi:MAG TPA: hypothetical protein PLS90_00135 [Candidatus Sumerlaeota bacterium]|nr:hypothetical protein [Candidatus Sumerlaeota bacterium]HOR26456.1 hypothetical protein [Candidatus Sumerlaeota bacterium]HPK00840.1 hypothetical protein [Candidatus Sumerlaeota bacterium]
MERVIRILPAGASLFVNGAGSLNGAGMGAATRQHGSAHPSIATVRREAMTVFRKIRNPKNEARNNDNKRNVRKA